MTTTYGLTYIGATDRAADAAFRAWVSAGRPLQLAFDFPGAAGPVPHIVVAR